MMKRRFLLAAVAAGALLSGPQTGSAQSIEAAAAPTPLLRQQETQL